MKKILFMFLCSSMFTSLFARSTYSSANQDTETNMEYKQENNTNDTNRDISSEIDSDPNPHPIDETERKIDQGNYEPENISEEDEDL